MPYKMHSQYLRQLFLDNDLAAGRYKVDGRPIAISDIHAPLFVVGTEWDHVAPWRSVFKVHLLADTEVTFVLTNGGHNAGIVSEPGHDHRHHRIATKRHDERYLDPEAWFAATAPREGSWWPELAGWLKARSGDMVKPPAMGSAGNGLQAICAAPGTYVFEA